jgi:hypothetical protein
MNIVINDYDGRDSYYEERHGSYIIWLGTNGNKTTNKMHELAHINMGTDVEEAREHIARWIQESNFTPEIIEYKHEIIAKSFFNVWNILEDERIESFSPRLFKEHKKVMGRGKTKRDVMHSPVEALLCARFNRYSLIDWHVKGFIKASRLASKERVYALAKNYCAYYITPWINENPDIYYGRDSIQKGL